MSDPSLLEAAARRYRADEWLGSSTLPGELHIRHWALDPHALPVLRPRHVRGLPAGLRTTSGLWSVGRDPDRLVRVDVSERRSRLAAHRTLTRVLAEVQSPALFWDEDSSLGDVAFTTAGGLVALFARGNLTVVVASVGRTQVDAMAIAGALDESLRRPPPADRERPLPGPLASRLSRQSGAVRRVDVRVPPAQRVRGLPMLRVYAPPGRLYEEDDDLLYEPAGPDVSGWVTVSAHADTTGTRGPSVLLRERL